MRALPMLLFAACTAASAQDAPPQKRFEHDMMVRLHMHENFDLVRAIEKLLIRGKLEEAQRLAGGIARAPDEPGMKAWSAQMVRVRDKATAVATATSVDEALRAEARLAEACMGCHLDAGVVAEFNSHAQPPPDKPTIEARMARHLWASDRLWEGIIGDAPDSWNMGLEVLGATPLPWPKADADRAALGKRLQKLAQDGRAAERTDRAVLYGEILVTCAACHTTK